MEILIQGGQFLLECKKETTVSLFTQKDLYKIAHAANLLTTENFHLREVEDLDTSGVFFIARSPITERTFRKKGQLKPEVLIEDIDQLLFFSPLDRRYGIALLLWKVIAQKSLLYRRYYY